MGGMFGRRAAWDVWLAGTLGADLTERVRRSRPNLAVLNISGQPNALAEHAGQAALAAVDPGPGRFGRTRLARARSAPGGWRFGRPPL